MPQIILKERTTHLASYTVLWNTTINSCLQMFFKIDVPKSFANFTGKRLYFGVSF